jgi:hypothetical protein
MVPTIALAILMGVVPGIFLRPMEPAVVQVIERVTGGQPQRVRFVPEPARHTAGAGNPPLAAPGQVVPTGLPAPADGLRVAIHD